MKLMSLDILKISDLEVIYRVSKYSAAQIRDYILSGEINRYLEAAENFVARSKISLVGPKDFMDLIGEEFEHYREFGYFRIYALNGVYLTVPKGKILACVGESGCGKSTLALSILRILPPNADAKGSIELDGVDIMSVSEPEMLKIRAVKLGYIGQGSYTYLNPLMTNAFQVLESAIVARGNNIDEAFKGFITAIREARINQRILLSFPMRLSGGEIRRVAFALALAKSPELLVCDEPFRNIDVYLAKQLAYALKDLIHKFQTTAIIFTHNLSLMAEIADELAVMYHGYIVERGNIVDIFRKPYHPYTKGLIGALPDPRKPKKKIIYVPGEPLPRLIRPKFCPFYNRCPLADEKCIEEIPEPRKFEGRIVACHNIEETWETDPIEFWSPHIGM